MRETIASKNEELRLKELEVKQGLRENCDLRATVYKLQEANKSIKSLELEIESLHKKRDELEAVHAFLDLVGAPDYPLQDGMNGYHQPRFRTPAMVRIAAQLALREAK